MKLSERTITLIKNFSSINQSMLFRKGSMLRTVDKDKTVMAEAEIKECFDRDFAIYDLNKFLGVLSLFNDPEIEHEDSCCVIEDQKQTLRYVYGDPGSFMNPGDKPIVFPSTDIIFDLSATDLKQVQRAGDVLQLPEIVVRGDGKDITIGNCNTKNPTADQFSIRIGETDKRFEAIFKSSRLRMLPGDYKVSLTDKKFSKFEADGLKYYVALEATSTFNK